MNIIELDLAIANCNPYDDKVLRKHFVTLRRKLERKIDKSLADIASGNLPASLKRQSK